MRLEGESMVAELGGAAVCDCALANDDADAADVAAALELKRCELKGEASCS